MTLGSCNLNELIAIETILFAAEWDYNPNIPPFAIQCNNEVYAYQIKKECGKYRVVTI